MLYAGSDDGVYRIDGVHAAGETTAERVLASGQAMRLRQFPSVPGLFAATETGLYHTTDGNDWTDLAVPRTKAYAVAADPTGDRLYAGTRPAHLYVTETVRPVGEAAPDPDAWRELDGFQDLPNREDWRLPRHDDLAQVRSLCTAASHPDRVVAGVEVGGVHVSDDGGETWEPRRVTGFDTPHTDDVHHLLAEDGETFVASMGGGLYRTTDGGRTWTRLDAGHPQWYVREAFVHDGVVYAGAAHGPTGTWAEESGYALLESIDGETSESVPYPTPEEVPAGFTSADGTVLAVTHAGTLLARREGAWERTGNVPTPGDVSGRYLPLSWAPELRA